MTYPRNSANPPTFDVGQVVQISDGVVQSSGVSVQIKVGTGSFGAGAGTLAYDSNTGIWNYTPTQGETDAETFIVQIYKTGCYSASVTVSTDDGTTNVTKIAGQAASASAPVTFPASVANETTVASRASQISVDAIPTNPLLTNDARLNYLNASIAAIPTNPLLTNDARLNFLDASIATSTNSILSAITGLNNLSAKCNLFGSAVLEAPETGSSVYEFTLVVNDDEGKLVNLDAAPTITATNSTGTDRSTNLSAVTNPSIGKYRFTYTVASTHPRESLRIEASGTTSTEARYAIWAGAVVDYDVTSILTQISSDLSLKPTLVQIEASTILAKQTDLLNRPTLVQMEASTILAHKLDIPTPGQIADAVLEESVDDHDGIAHSLAKYVSIIKKTNTVVEGTVLASPTPTTTVFRCAIDYPTGAFEHSVLFFAEDASVAEQNSPIVTWVNNGDGTSTITLEEPTTSAPVAGDMFYIVPSSHVHAITDIQNGLATSAALTVVSNNVLELLTRVPTATAQLVTDLTAMLVGSGTALVKWTANALSLAPAGGGGGGATSVTPEAFINLDNTLLEKNTFVFFNNETRSYLITLASGTFDGLPMTFCIELANKSTLVVQTGLTSVTNAVTVTVPSTAPQADNCMQWSLRDTATGRIILYGPAIQKYAAFDN